MPHNDPLGCTKDGSKKNRKRKKGVMFFLAVSCAVLACLLVMVSPYFHIVNVEISGVSMYSEGFLHSRMGLGVNRGDSIFYRSARSMEKSLESLPYIRAARVVKEYPGTLLVTVSERIPRVCVYDELLNVYLCVDEEGYVLEIKNQGTDDLPVMSGIKLSGYSIGQTLTSDNPEAAAAMSRLSSIFRRYNITFVDRADVSDPNSIRLYINNITVHIGGIEDADEKINWAIACIAELDPAIRGDLYARSADTSYFVFP